MRVPGDFSMPIAQLAHVGERGCRRWLAAETDDDRARAATIISEFITEALTVDVIALLRDAVA